MLLIAQLAAILVAARLVGLVFRRLQQPQVVGEMDLDQIRIEAYPAIQAEMTQGDRVACTPQFVAERAAQKVSIFGHQNQTEASK